MARGSGKKCFKDDRTQYLPISDKVCENHFLYKTETDLKFISLTYFAAVHALDCWGLLFGRDTTVYVAYFLCVSYNLLC